LQPSLTLTVKACAKSTTQYAILHSRNTRAYNAAQAQRARMLSIPRITKAQQTNCGSPQSKVDNSIELSLSHPPRLEFRSYLRSQLEGLYRQNTHHCLANVAKKRDPALLRQLSWKYCASDGAVFSVGLAHTSLDTGGRCDTFIFITLHKIFNDKVLYVTVTVVSGYSKWNLKREIHIQSHCCQNKYSKC